MTKSECLAKTIANTEINSANYNHLSTVPFFGDNTGTRDFLDLIDELEITGCIVFKSTGGRPVPRDVSVLETDLRRDSLVVTVACERRATGGCELGILLGGSGGGTTKVDCWELCIRTFIDRTSS